MANFRINFYFIKLVPEEISRKKFGQNAFFFLFRCRFTPKQYSEPTIALSTVVIYSLRQKLLSYSVADSVTVDTEIRDWHFVRFFIHKTIENSHSISTTFAFHAVLPSEVDYAVKVCHGLLSLLFAIE